MNDNQHAGGGGNAGGSNTAAPNALDNTLRPGTLDAIIGQDMLKASLRVFIQAAKNRDAAIDHILFRGPPGLGKTTFAFAAARDTGSRIESVTGPVLTPSELSERINRHIQMNRPQRRYNPVTQRQEEIPPPGTQPLVLFVDEIHATPKETHELLYPLMEDFKFKGQSVPPFTLIGATTDPAKLPTPLRDRFGLDYMIDYYDEAALAQIIRRGFSILYPRITATVEVDALQDAINGEGMAMGDFPDQDVDDPLARINDLVNAAGVEVATIDEEAVYSLAKRARGTPRTALRLMKRALDYMEVGGTFTLTMDITRTAMTAIGVDASGMNEVDRKIINALGSRFHRPVGVETLAVAIGEDFKSVATVHEPWLVREGLVDRERNGRTLTMRGQALAANIEAGNIEW